MNINEKFLLTLLESTEFGYFFESEPDYLYFYPENLELEIRVKYSIPTTNVNIQFMHSSTNEEIVNFLIESPDEVKDFLKLLYQKYENQLNQNLPSLPQEAMDIFEDMLKRPLDNNYPYNFDISSKNPYIEENKKFGCSISLYECLSPNGSLKVFKPLEPLAIPCYYTDGSDDSEDILHYKVIPTYLSHDYPILSKVVNYSRVVTNTSDFSDVLYSLGGELAPKLNTLILDLELEEKQKTKKNRSKI